MKFTVFWRQRGSVFCEKLPLSLTSNQVQYNCILSRNSEGTRQSKWRHKTSSVTEASCVLRRADLCEDKHRGLNVFIYKAADLFIITFRFKSHHRVPKACDRPSTAFPSLPTFYQPHKQLCERSTLGRCHLQKCKWSNFMEQLRESGSGMHREHTCGHLVHSMEGRRKAYYPPNGVTRGMWAVRLVAEESQAVMAANCCPGLQK